MNQELLQFVKDKTQALIDAPSCSAEAKAAAEAWLAAVGTADEAAETKKYLAELEADIVTADALAALADSDMGKKIFGDAAPGVAAHARDIKAAGAQYCDCPACAACEAILAKKDEILA
ncbi:MAG: molecular chaperone Hsp90 [Peptococcaceae bacterium]|nr:molecular chaperone Hsp90 [Peptococcaceae bacterium]